VLKLSYQSKGVVFMKMDKVANSGNDEFYTPAYAIEPLIPFIQEKKYQTIWCPFDTEKSLFVKIFQQKGFKVVYSHLELGNDFFSEETPECDIIISNPPYSEKGRVFENLFWRDKPFAMLVGVVGLFESAARFNMFQNNDFEILYFNKRIAYFKSYEEQKPSLNPPFSSVYLTRKLLPKQINFAYIKK
jgi:hypothetical protein